MPTIHLLRVVVDVNRSSFDFISK
ncbi:MAG: hypothetical protein QOJ05_809, partial [Verrucomicrobiota bacterium]